MSNASISLNTIYTQLDDEPIVHVDKNGSATCMAPILGMSGIAPANSRVFFTIWGELDLGFGDHFFLQNTESDESGKWTLWLNSSDRTELPLVGGIYTIQTRSFVGNQIISNLVRLSYISPDMTEIERVDAKDQTNDAFIVRGYAKPESKISLTWETVQGHRGNVLTDANIDGEWSAVTSEMGHLGMMGAKFLACGRNGDKQESYFSPSPVFGISRI